ncbi:TonB-dependent receptor [Ferruginibacter albus]|nr:TonB-dependent receptor [Ferruginibacter albus]
MATLLFTIVIAFAQTGNIKGVIKTSDGQPAEFVNVELKGAAKMHATNSDGEYEIKNVKPGAYTIVVSYAGLKTQEQNVEVKAGETATSNFTLSENATQIEGVIINSHRAKTSSDYASKMPLKNLENSQVYNVVSADLMKQQGTTNFDDALNNVPGIHKLWESTGRGYGDGAAYYSLRGFEAQATIVNGLPGVTSGSLDPSNIEKIEVIKGPSGTLFGSSLISYGGFVNTVTKKPYADFGGEIDYIAGSFGLNRITADINTPLDKEKKVLLRVNAAYHSENNFQDAGFRDAVFLAPTLSYKVNDRLSFDISTEFMQEEKTNPMMLFLGRNTPLQFKNLAELNYNRNLSLTSNDLSINNPRYNLQAQMKYKLSDKWTSQTVLSRCTSGSDGYYSYLYDNENGTGQFSLWVSKQKAHTNTSDIQQNFIGDFKIGSVRNRMVIGLDYFERNIIDNSTGYAWVENVTPQGDVNYIYPYTGDTLAPISLSKQSVDNALAPTGISNSNSKDETMSAYVADIVNITPKLIATASIRADYFHVINGYNQTGFSPKFGLVYQLLKDKISVFGNYMNGFKNVAPSQADDPTDTLPPTIQTFKPEHVNQMEFGIKTELSEKLNATLSFYDAKVANVVIAIPGTVFSSQGGEVESKGVELDLNANPVKGLNVITGFSYNDSKVIKGDDANVWLETGRRPIYSGPKTMANFWATYDFSNKLKGFGIGFGGNYSSELAILDSKVTGTFVLPSYTVLNASVYYNVNKFRLALNVDNVTNKDYFTGYSTINPQKPRNVVVTLGYKF